MSRANTVVKSFQTCHKQLAFGFLFQSNTENLNKSFPLMKISMNFNPPLTNLFPSSTLLNKKEKNNHSSSSLDFEVNFTGE